MSDHRTVAVYFVASPLQYLAARRIAGDIERDAKQVLVWYKPGMKAVVDASEWDACTYMPWPRWEPLPGWFGRHRRLRANIGLVAGLVGRCDRLLLHSAVFDTEAINYFLHALPQRAGAREMHARILPDGLISIRRYPLSFPKRLMQRLRLLRSLFAPELRYTCFARRSHRFGCRVLRLHICSARFAASVPGGTRSGCCRRWLCPPDWAARRPMRRGAHW
jgi:hypothetical protein